MRKFWLGVAIVVCGLVAAFILWPASAGAQQTGRSGGHGPRRHSRATGPRRARRPSSSGRG